MISCAEIVSVKNKVLLPRSGHKIIADNKYLYVIGGFVELREATNVSQGSNEVRGEIWRLHFVYNTWEKCIFDKEIFSLAASHSVVKHGDCLFITGGTGLPFGVNILNHVIVIDIKKMTQKKYQFQPKNNLSKNLPIATYGHSVTFVEIDKRPCIIVIGGTTGNTYHQEVYKIDLISLESVLVANSDATNAPRSRYKHEAFLYGENIYMLGGTTQTSSMFSLDQIHLFNVKTNCWTTQSTNTKYQINKGFRCPSMCQNGQFIYLTGGCPNGLEISTGIYQLDLSDLSWRNIGHWMRPCYFHDSVFVPHLGSIFIFGGVCRTEPPKRTNELYEFKPLSARMAPTLTDLACKSVVDLVIKARRKFGYSDETNLSKDLSNMGLPDSIINRIDIGNCIVTFAA